MPRIGQLRKRVQFLREITAGATATPDDLAEDDLGNPLEDDLANPVQGFANYGKPRWGRLIPMRGAEGFRDGGAEATYSHELEIRDSAFARTISAAERATVDGVAFSIVTPPMQSERPGLVTMRLEQGAAT